MINRYFIAVVALAGIVLLVFQAVRVSSAVSNGTLDELPRISELTESPQPIACVYNETYSPHDADIRVIGRVDSKTQLFEIFPFLQNVESVPGGDTLCSRIRFPLFEMAESKTAFEPTDPLWLTSVDGLQSGRSMPIRAGYSERTGYFYLEYHWSR